ncbi:MAG: ATP-dependent DNA helicase [Armatimonas sp.]
MSFRLTREQKSIITAPLGDVQISASAGSGKSSVAALRIAYALKKQSLKPHNICALTFGKAAAENLFNRIISTVQEKFPEPILGLPNLFTGTVHSFAMHALKAHIPRFRKFEVIGDAERRLLVRRRFNYLGIGCIPRVGVGSDSEDGFPFLTVAPQDIALFLDSVDRVRDECLPEITLPPELLYSFQAYKHVLEHESTWDYSEVIDTFNRTISDDTSADCLGMQEAVRGYLRLVACDEAQDCDRAMWQLLLRLRELGVSLWTIGDSKQSIYRWRSANPEEFLSFSERVGAPAYTLSANFRSSVAVVSLANSFAQRFLGEPNPGMTSLSHLQNESGDIAAVSFGSQTQQYQWIARRLKAILGIAWRDATNSPARGLSQSDMTVLTRTRRQMVDIASALRAEGLNVVVGGADGLLVPLEAQALATTVDFLSGGTASWDKKLGQMVLEPVSEDDVVLAARRAFSLDDQAIEHSMDWLRTLPHSPEWEQPICLIEILESWLQHMGIRYSEDSTAAEETRWLAIRRILDAAAAYQRWGFATPLGTKIQGFSRWLRVEASTVLKDERKNGGLWITPDAITVQTVHNAKGLEYAVVVVPDLAEGSFPSRPRPASLWQIMPQNRLSPEQIRRLDGMYSDKLRDEANLFYVALTRSKRYLFLTYAPPERAKRPKPSPFLAFARGQSYVEQNPQQLPISALPVGRLTPTPRREATALQITATQLAAYLNCPRQFYLRFVLNVPPPLVQALGYGNSLHNAAWEIHRRVSTGEELSPADVETIARRHNHLPFASAATRTALQEAGIASLKGYAERFQASSETPILTEQEVRLEIGSMTINGRIDLITKDNDCETLVELKNATDHIRDPDQVIAKTYALAAQSSMGRMPDRVETRLIARDSSSDRITMMTEDVVKDTQTRIEQAGKDIVSRRFSPIPLACVCSKCDVKRICAAAVDDSHDS